jgi:hypothetical protein
MKRQEFSAEVNERWRAVDLRYRGRLAVAAALTATGIVSTWLSAKFAAQPVAIICAILVFGAVAWTIRLIVGRRRAILNVLVDSGLTKKEAILEVMRREGG